MDFIKMTLEGIRANKTIKKDPTERLEHLKSILTKNLIGKYKTKAKTFSCGFK